MDESHVTSDADDEEECSFMNNLEKNNELVDNSCEQNLKVGNVGNATIYPASNF